MTTTRLPRNLISLLPTLTWDQLAMAYDILNDRAVAASVQSVACSRAMALRDRVSDEVSRRGCVIRRAAVGCPAMVGYPADFVPCCQKAAS
jgi:hypothetical protein